MRGAGEYSERRRRRRLRARAIALQCGADDAPRAAVPPCPARSAPLARLARASGVIWLVARMPYAVLLAHRPLRRLARRAPDRQRAPRHGARNIELCFPELRTPTRARLLEQNLRDSGVMLVEFALAWMGSARAIARIPVTIEGLEHLEAARAAKRGVLLVGAHFSHLELCARLVSQRIRIAGMYREHEDAAFEWAIKRARLHYATRDVHQGRDAPDRALAQGRRHDLVRAGPGHARQGRRVRAVLRRAGGDDHRDASSGAPVGRAR